MCGPGRCKDKGTGAEPIEIDCPSCSGAGCDQCNDGTFRLDGCPNDYCRAIAGTVEMIELFNKGLPPIAGGSLDQSVWFIQDASTLNREDDLAKQVEA